MDQGTSGSGSIGRKRFVVLALLMLVIGGLATLITWSPFSKPTATNLSSPPGVSGVRVNEEQEQFSASIQGLPKGESGQLMSLEDYWYTRVGYPTMQFNGSWLLQAAQQDKVVTSKLPAGRITYANTAELALTLNPTAWTALGPQPLQMNGCSGCYNYGKSSGRVNDIEVDPVFTNTAYIAAVGGGVWKTTNCCSIDTVWTVKTDDPLISTSSIDDLSIDPNNPAIIYAGTGDLNYGSFSMGSIGVLKSTDRGETWAVKGADVFTPYFPEPAGQFPQYQSIGKVEADPNNSNTVIAGTKTGIYLSYNGGDDWTGPCFTNVYTASQRQDVTGLILSDAGAFTDMYVAVGTRGYSTTVQYNLSENGANGIYKAQVPTAGCPTGWNLISRADNGWPAGTGSGIPQYQAGGDQLGRIDMAIAPSDPNYLYAIVQAINPTANRGGVLGVWRTTDAGTTWTQQAGVGSSAAEWQGCDRAGTQSWYNQHIAVDPNDPNTVYADTIDIFKSTDGADTFSNVTCGYTGGTTEHVDQHALEYVPGQSSMLLAGSDGGVYVTANADSASPTWQQMNENSQHHRVLRRRHHRQLRQLQQPGHQWWFAGQRLPCERLDGLLSRCYSSPRRHPVAASQRWRRYVRPYRACARPAMVPGEPERRASRQPDRPLWQPQQRRSPRLLGWRPPQLRIPV